MSNVSKRTIDYYTQMGLLEAQRSESNYRYYSEDSLTRLKMIEVYKKEHMTLEEIKGRIDLLNNRNIVDNDILEKVDYINQQLKNIEGEILQLKPFLDKLNEKQLKQLVNGITIRGTAFLQTLVMILGEDPFI